MFSGTLVWIYGCQKDIGPARGTGLFARRKGKGGISIAKPRAGMTSYHADACQSPVLAAIPTVTHKSVHVEWNNMLRLEQELEQDGEVIRLIGWLYLLFLFLFFSPPWQCAAAVTNVRLHGKHGRFSFALCCF